MTDLVRFGISIERKLLETFDRTIARENYPNRTEAFRHLMRQYLVNKEWMGTAEVAGAITVVYEHDRSGLVAKLTHIQHHFNRIIVSSQHIHMDSENCLEIIAVRGKPRRIQEFLTKIRALKGVKHTSLSMATTGEMSD